jgi:hypothetical protein
MKYIITSLLFIFPIIILAEESAREPKDKNLGWWTVRKFEATAVPASLPFDKDHKGPFSHLMLRVHNGSDYNLSSIDVEVTLKGGKSKVIRAYGMNFTDFEKNSNSTYTIIALELL